MSSNIYSVDDDREAGYEYLSFKRKILDLFFLPLLNSLPKSFSKLIKRSNRSAKDVIDNATTHEALEVLYNHGFPQRQKGFLPNFFQKVWFNLHNSKAVRNRLRLVAKEIRRSLEKIDKRESDIRILSIASGSSRAIFESLKRIDPKLNKCSVTFLDKSPKALKYSESLRDQILPDKNPNWNYRWVEDTANNFVKHFQEENSLDLIEMVGLLDYFDEEKTLKILKNIFRYLQPDGTLITANITDSKEKRFITNVVGWPMIYKSPEELIGLIKKAGFDSKKVKAVYEPLQTHLVIIAQK